MIIETERLMLREATPADADFFLELISEPLYKRFIADRGLSTKAEAITYIEDRILSAYRLHGFGQYVIVLKETGHPIGTAGMIVRDGVADPDLGYALLQQHHGKGFGSEAGAAVLDHARNVLKLPRALAFTDPENEASKAVLRKLGFRDTGTRDHPIVGISSFFEKTL